MGFESKIVTCWKKVALGKLASDHVEPRYQLMVVWKGFEIQVKRQLKVKEIMVNQFAVLHFLSEVGNGQ